MQEQYIPVLIFAQSGRFLAQSASQAGYPVWVADCFGDQDTLAIAERWQQSPRFSELTSSIFLKILADLTQGESCLFIAGSGIELCYSLLEILPANITLVGNKPQTIKQIKTPALFFDLLGRLKLPYPDTYLKRPLNNKRYLIKSASGLGGSHIQYSSHQTNISDAYFQCFIAGKSGSALILANGKSAQIISINQQFLSPLKDMPFRLGAIESPWNISKQHRQQLAQAANLITSELGLLGLNSLDFIISNNQLQLLEINPRPSASAELVSKEIPIFHYHINACRGDLPSHAFEQEIKTMSLHYFYAVHDCVIPIDIIWPEECRDLPNTGAYIKDGQPICTFISNPHRTNAIKRSIAIQLTR
ncbi:MAG: ATP-grasp domain-containing protein [Piscirickettsiaceae bacterium]|nr:ATP-grasp domain-containing protein [Piscirickettsiaceae bacterium]